MRAYGPKTVFFASFAENRQNRQFLSFRRNKKILEQYKPRKLLLNRGMQTDIYISGANGRDC